MPKRILGFVLKLAITAGLFVLLFRPETYGLSPDYFGGVTPRKLWDELAGVDFWNVAFWLTFGVLIKLAGMMAGVIRWRLLLLGQGLNIPFLYMVQSWFVGRFFGIFLPGTIGLDGYRLYDSVLYTREPIKSATVIAVEKLIGFISLTFLVFLTFPLGFKLLNINVAVLAAILAGLGGFVLVSFLVLLNPRVIQVLVAVMPVPASIRNKVDKLGAAITAYSGRRTLLLGAVLCGLCVHLGTCFMFFGTMTAIKAVNTSMWDILFASPLMIYGTVILPSIGGEGIREIAFAKLLGAKSGVASSVLFAHLGWWVGEVVPFLIGAPIFFLRSRSKRKDLAEEVAATRREAAGLKVSHMAPEAVAAYRTKLMDCVLAGLSAGIVGGAMIGLCEAIWIHRTLGHLPDYSALWWGPLAYGMVFAAVGVGLAKGLAFLYLIRDRFAPAFATFGLSLCGVIVLGGGIGFWRYTRDVLQGHAPTGSQVLTGLGLSVGVGLVCGCIGAGIGQLLRGRRKASVGLVLFSYCATISLGAEMADLSGFRKVGHCAVSASGPDIILIAADALRVDYLKKYSKDAVADTPCLDAFASDSILFTHWFSQASWTKPSFATMFSGRYPGSHTATAKMSMLPEDVTTFPEILQEAGYFTKGFSNNGNIAAAFNFDKGFSDYVDPKVRLYFGAGESASSLSLYQVLRKVRHTLMSKVSRKMVVTDFYQPAESVTEGALAWLDSAQRPSNRPFFLFLHYMDTHDPFMDYGRPGIGYARVRMPNPDPAKFLEPMKQAYISDIEHMDRYLGVLFDGLRQRGMYDDAVILFTSDHGEEFYDHKGWWHGQTLFDEVVHVPLLLKQSKNSQGGTVNDGLGQHIDIAPTLLQFACLKPAAEMPGKSIFDVNGGLANADTAFVYAENDFENNVIQAVRTRDTKVIHENEDNARRLPARQFYDLVKDSSEQQNLAGQNDSRQSDMDRLVGEMTAYIKGGAAEPTLVKSMSQEQMDQLRAIGYGGNE